MPRNYLNTNRIHPEFSNLYLSVHVSHKSGWMPLFVWRRSAFRSSEIEKSFGAQRKIVWLMRTIVRHLKESWKM